jgi:hypothetical protein
MLITHLHFSAEFKNEWSYSSIPPVYFHGVYNEIYYLHLQCGTYAKTSLVSLRHPTIHFHNLIYFSRLDFRGISLSPSQISLSPSQIPLSRLKF